MESVKFGLATELQALSSVIAHLMLIHPHPQLLLLLWAGSASQQSHGWGLKKSICTITEPGKQGKTECSWGLASQHTTVLLQSPQPSPHWHQFNQSPWIDPTSNFITTVAKCSLTWKVQPPELLPLVPEFRLQIQNWNFPLSCPRCINFGAGCSPCSITWDQSTTPYRLHGEVCFLPLPRSFPPPQVALQVLHSCTCVLPSQCVSEPQTSLALPALCCCCDLKLLMRNRLSWPSSSAACFLA